MVALNGLVLRRGFVGLIEDSYRIPFFFKFSTFLNSKNIVPVYFPLKFHDLVR